MSLRKVGSSRSRKSYWFTLESNKWTWASKMRSIAPSSYTALDFKLAHYPCYKEPNDAPRPLRPFHPSARRVHEPAAASVMSQRTIGGSRRPEARQIGERPAELSVEREGGGVGT